jgi:prepilin-type N-terminal cleavage/methylation domain-containing protein
MNSKRKQGFTLVELLIVIAIIGLLVAVGLPALLAAQRNSRDNARLQSLKGIADVSSGLYTKYSKLINQTFTLTSTTGTDNVTITDAAGHTEKITVVNYSALTSVATCSNASASYTTTRDQIIYIHDNVNRKITLCKEDNSSETIQY